MTEICSSWRREAEEERSLLREQVSLEGSRQILVDEYHPLCSVVRPAEIPYAEREYQDKFSRYVQALRRREAEIRANDPDADLPHQICW